MNTLEDIYQTHPEWRNLPIVIESGKGFYDWVDGSALVYEAEDKESPCGKVLVFATN